METFLIRLLQFILAISLLVLLHEGGHMFFAKLFGVRVEKFFVFFDVGIGKWKVNFLVGNLRKTIRNMVWVGCHLVATARFLV